MHVIHINYSTIFFNFFRTKTPDASGFKLIKPQRQSHTNKSYSTQKPHRATIRVEIKKLLSHYKASPVQSTQACQALKRDHVSHRSHSSLAAAYTCRIRCWAVLIKSASLRLPNRLHCCKRRLHLNMILAGCVGNIPWIVSLFLVSHKDQRSAPTQLHTTRFVEPCSAPNM